MIHIYVWDSNYTSCFHCIQAIGPQPCFCAFGEKEISEGFWDPQL